MSLWISLVCSRSYLHWIQTVCYEEESKNGYISEKWLEGNDCNDRLQVGQFYSTETSSNTCFMLETNWFQIQKGMSKACINS